MNGLVGGLTLATWAALEGAILALLYVWPPEWAVKLRDLERVMALWLPLGMVCLTPMVFLLHPKVRGSMCRIMLIAATPALAIQVEVLWLLCGQVFEPERYWVTVGALIWLMIAYRDPLQAGLALFVILHGLIGGQDIFRGGYALVGAAAVVSALLGSIVWQVVAGRSRNVFHAIFPGLAAVLPVFFPGLGQARLDAVRARGPGDGPQQAATLPGEEHLPEP